MRDFHGTSGVIGLSKCRPHRHRWLAGLVVLKTQGVIESPGKWFEYSMGLCFEQWHHIVTRVTEHDAQTYVFSGNFAGNSEQSLRAALVIESSLTNLAKAKGLSTATQSSQSNSMR